MIKNTDQTFSKNKEKFIHSYIKTYLKKMNYLNLLFRKTFVLLNALLNTDKFISINNLIMSASKSRRYLKSYRLNYLYSAQIDQLTINPNRFISLDQNIKKIPIKDKSIHDLLEFLKANYYMRWPRNRNLSDYQAIAEKTPEYFLNELLGYWYIKNNELVGILMCNVNIKHSFIGEKVLHIGFWGYQQKALSEIEARQIKNDWLIELQKLTNSNNVKHITANIEDFNIPSQNFAKKIGLKIKAVRAEKRR